MRRRRFGGFGILDLEEFKEREGLLNNVEDIEGSCV